MINNLIAEAVDDASSAMANVQTAADAISDAISKVTPLLTGQTWTGAAATSWENDWHSTYTAVKACLGELPAAETAVINGVRTQMDALVAKQHHPAA